MKKEIAFKLVETGKLTQKEIMKICEDVIDQEFYDTIIRAKKVNLNNMLILAKKLPKSKELETAMAESINWDKMTPKQMVAIGFKIHKHIIWKEIDKKINWNAFTLLELLDIEKKHNLPDSAWEKYQNKK